MSGIVVILDDGGGHHEPQRLFTDYTISPEDYQTFKNQPIPPKEAAPQSVEGEGETMQAPALEPEAITPVPSRQDSAAKKRNETLLQLFQEKKQQEQPDYVRQYYCGQAG